jgi:predicted GIY-YIG superfamily endonuclease
MTDTQSTHAVNPVEILYRLRGRDTELLYVGITRDWPTRMKQHAAEKPWAHEVRHTEIVYIDGTRKQIEAIERAVIKTEAPKYNVTHNVTTPPTDERTQNQRDADRINAVLVSEGFPPFAWVDNNDSRRSFVGYLHGNRRRPAIERMARLWCELHDPSDPYRCALTYPHDCKATARDVGRGLHCQLPEDLSFT